MPCLLYCTSSPSKCSQSAFVQWRSQPNLWSCKCKFFSVYRPYKGSISKEMNNDNSNLHSMTKLSSWLHYCIRASSQIQGVTIPHSAEGYKCSGYTDDTTVAVTTEQSIEETFSVYSTYERASGAKLNRGKSKAMWVGSWKALIPLMGCSG